MYCWVRVSRNPIVFDSTMKKVYLSLLKVRSGSLNAQSLWHIYQILCFGKRYRLFPWIKSWPDEIERKMIVKFCSCKFHVTFSVLHATFSRLTRNDITVKIKGRGTCNNSKQLLQACGVKLIHNVIKNHGPSPVLS